MPRPVRNQPSRPMFRRPRAPTTWARSVAVGYTLLSPSSRLVTDFIVLSNPGIGETIRRTRGLLSIKTDDPSALEDQVGAFGAVIVSDSAATAGVGSIPTPVTEASDDGWFVWMPFLGSTKIVGEAGVINYEYDSKAMRRVEEGFVAAFVIENSSTTDGLLFANSLSVLTSLS